MKINEMKDELEKFSKFIPELRQDLDKLYMSDSAGKKSRLKQLWKDYQDKTREVKDSREYRILQ